MDAGEVAEDFSDESSVELHHSRRKYCRRPTGARMDPRFTQKTVKFGGGKIMVWGYIQNGDVRKICKVVGNINSLKYLDVLATSYIPNHKRGQILQQDGALSHTSISTSKFLKAKKIKVLQDWPAQSPDMNIIEHVWGRMKEEAWKTKPKNLDELWEAFSAPSYRGRLGHRSTRNCESGQKYYLLNSGGPQCNPLGEAAELKPLQQLRVFTSGAQM
ncbi:hypothetical protein SRHO_G00118520 [Serrasalmus rhombeus]